MKAFLDAILVFIGTNSLSNQEFELIDLPDTANNLAVYEALVGVLESREAVSDISARLQLYFLAKGIQVAAPGAPSMSNIFVGASLDEY